MNMTPRGAIENVLFGVEVAIGARIGWGLTTWIIGILSSHVG